MKKRTRTMALKQKETLSSMPLKEGVTSQVSPRERKIHNCLSRIKKGQKQNNNEKNSKQKVRNPTPDKEEVDDEICKTNGTRECNADQDILRRELHL